MKVRSCKLSPIEKLSIKYLELLDIFRNFDFLLKDIVGDIVFENQSWEQKVDVVSFNESIQCFSKCNIDLWCKLLFQNGDLTLVRLLTVIAFVV